ncbi:MAG TPA: GWxTD domain-containing protein [Thermoanaerobaculia bacterium]|nr:GWxTD domain-containing protein [Thermoanaerobaculia bacterium]
MRPLLAGALVSLLLATRGRAQDPRIAELTDLFAKAKAQFRGGAYAESLATLQKLDAALGAPDLAAAKEKTSAAMAFYRGADLAALGHGEEARREFRVYLEKSPATKLDPGMYPRSVLDAFEAARAEIYPSAGAAPTGAAIGLAEAYASFRAPVPVSPADETWGDGAVRFLMTKEEKAEWSRLADSAARAEFVAAFWQRRDRTPETPENEYRDEIERRIRFADAQFAQREKKGSLTDRGMVFVLMGPPSYVASRLLRIEDDPIQAARSAPRTEAIMGPTGRVGTLTVTPQPMTAEKIQGSREVWHYRRDRLPVSVASNEVLFEFLTKDGYGTAVLQREAAALTTLEIAAGAGAVPTAPAPFSGTPGRTSSDP